MSSRQKYHSTLLLGTNLGNRENNLELAICKIAIYCGIIIKESSIYETAAWGLTNQPAFLNKVLQIETEFSPQDLIKKILKIELDLGRERIVKMGPRIIDIDILLIENLIINQENLQVPHPRMQDRKFVLLPLNEIASETIHPVLNITINELLQQCSDQLDVNIYHTKS